jgi:hypothetical protein
MSDDEDLESLLADFDATQKPAEQRLQEMGNGHFGHLVSLVDAELRKRQPIDYGSLNNADFRAVCDYEISKATPRVNFNGKPIDK